MVDKFRETFKEEVLENILSIENSLLKLEVKNDSEALSLIFRSLHNIKGSAAMFGFEMTSLLVHDIETVLEPLKLNQINFNSKLVNNTLLAIDFIRSLVEADEKLEREKFNFYKNELIENIKNSINSSKDENKNDSHAFKNNDTLSSNLIRHNLKFYKIIFKPSKDILFFGLSPLSLISKLKELGESQVKAIKSKIPPLDKIESNKIYIEWEIILKTKAEISEINEVFSFLNEGSKVEILEITNNSSKILKDERREKDLNSLNSEILSQSLLEESVEIQAQRAQVNISSIKVEAKKLDHLVDLVGELVTLNSKLTQEAEKSQINTLTTLSTEITFLVNELRDYSTSLRAIPLEFLFSKFQRFVRESALELNKEIVYLTSGGDISIDKTIIERLSEPILHLIRNSLSHGIESIQERKVKSKPEQAYIKISAEQLADRVIITIEDDGRGLDSKKILTKALEVGLINDEQAKTISESEIFNLIFTPGFSTAKKLSALSGRGIGMDVVKRDVELLRGSISLESKLDFYTKVILNFPLTLAIIEGWLLRVHDNYYIIPLSTVEACFKFEREKRELLKSEKTLKIKYLGELINAFYIKDIFSLNSHSNEEYIVIANSNKQRVAIIVDEVIGEQQTVIKNLGHLYTNVDGISGASILADGNIALVLDINAILKNPLDS